MDVSLIQIGDSKGIRIPKSIIAKLNIKEKLSMEINNNEIILKPLKREVRAGWEEAFNDMHDSGEDKLLIDDTLETTDFEWDW